VWIEVLPELLQILHTDFTSFVIRCGFIPIFIRYVSALPHLLIHSSDGQSVINYRWTALHCLLIFLHLFETMPPHAVQVVLSLFYTINNTTG
jgi:hypothetical protein